MGAVRKKFRWQAAENITLKEMLVHSGLGAGHWCKNHVVILSDKQIVVP